MESKSDVLSYLTNHLFLPPELPQEDDSSPEETRALLHHVTDSAAAFCSDLRSQNVDVGVLHKWLTLHRMLKSMKVLHKSQYIPLEDLRNLINNMKIHGTAWS
jgi:hypothetical protein